MGTLKVDGHIEAVGNIIINVANNVDRFLHFDSTDSTGGYDWRIGYLGTGADNANYLVFQSTGNAGENWTSALQFGLNDLNATFAGSILPLTNNSKTIGSSSYKWSNIYATTFTGALSGTASKATNLTVTDGSTDVERKILVTTEATSGQNTYCVPGVTANYVKKTLTAAGGFIGNLTGNATSASAAPWSGITGKPDYYPVRQSKSTASNYRPLLMHYINGGYGADPGTTNEQVYYNETIAACPSTGAIAATKFIGALQGNADTATTASAVAWGNVTGKPSSFTPSSHTHDYIEPKGIYTFTSSTLPNSFDFGISCGFVDTNAGFGNYGSVLTVRTYSGGGGTLQLYAPYSPTYGGTRLKARFGNYDSSTGNSWTSLKEIAWLSDLNSYLPLSGGTITATSSTDTPLAIQSGDTDAYIRFSDKSGTTLGYYGVNSSKEPIFYLSGEKPILYSGNYTSYTVTKTGSGASGTWGINITGSAGSVAWGNVTGKPSTFTPSSHTHTYLVSGGTPTSTSSHADALSQYFNSNKASIPRNCLLTYYSSALGNGSQYMGYFLSGYDSTPYGGFYVAHYDTPYYVGILYGSYNQQAILTSSNYASWCAPASHSHSSYLLLTGGTVTGKLQVNAPIVGYNYTNTNNGAAFIFDKPGSNWTGIGSNGQSNTIQFGPCDGNGTWASSPNQIWTFKGCIATSNYGNGDPTSSTHGTGTVGAIYFKTMN